MLDRKYARGQKSKTCEKRRLTVKDYYITKHMNSEKCLLEGLIHHLKHKRGICNLLKIIILWSTEDSKLKKT